MAALGCGCRPALSLLYGWASLRWRRRVCWERPAPLRVAEVHCKSPFSKCWMSRVEAELLVPTVSGGGGSMRGGMREHGWAVTVNKLLGSCAD
jgi:hypothetical protein